MAGYLAPFPGREQGLISACGWVKREAMHIVDELIYERAPQLVTSSVWPLARPLLYGILGYRKAVAMADGIRDLSGAEALDYVSRLLRLKVGVKGLEHLPASGRCVVVCNHPTGIADGIAVADAIRRVRSDAIFFANADALRVNPRFDEALIPVEWVAAKRTHKKTRDTLLAAQAAFEAERCVVIFPAGRLARRDSDGRLTDPAWAPTAVSLAQKYRAPIVPIHLTGPAFLLVSPVQPCFDGTARHHPVSRIPQQDGQRLRPGHRPRHRPRCVGDRAPENLCRATADLAGGAIHPQRHIMTLDLSRSHLIALPDEAATAALGAAIAPLLRRGDVVYLTGTLGMGKSTLARGLIRALTTPDQDVPSPTFTLVQSYDTPAFELLHLDLYRLEDSQETLELGLDDALNDGVLLIEWPDRLGHLGFDARLDIVLEQADNTNSPRGGGRIARLAPQGHFRED